MASTPDFRLPDLQFVPTDAVFPHEYNDIQRSGPLVHKLRESGVLKNPPIVTQVGDGMRVEPRYVVLDGANRATAARAAGWPHVVVQVVRYESPNVELMTWYHGLTGDGPERLEARLAGIAGLTLAHMDKLHARAALARREALACVARSDGDVLVLQGGQTLQERNALLNVVVGTYHNLAPYVRVATDSLSEAQREHPEITGLVIFPRYDPSEVIDLASTGDLLPAGITRHLIRWRALRVNAPVAMCEDTTMPLERKNAWLRSWVDERLRARAVRFYEEPTVLFDE